MTTPSSNMIQIYCINTEQHYLVPRGSNLLEIYDMIGLQLPTVLFSLVANLTKKQKMLSIKL